MSGGSERRKPCHVPGPNNSGHAAQKPCAGLCQKMCMLLSFKVYTATAGVGRSHELSRRVDTPPLPPVPYPAPHRRVHVHPPFASCGTSGPRQPRQRNAVGKCVRRSRRCQTAHVLTPTRSPTQTTSLPRPSACSAACNVELSFEEAHACFKACRRREVFSGFIPRKKLGITGTTIDAQDAK